MAFVQLVTGFIARPATLHGRAGADAILARKFMPQP